MRVAHLGWLLLAAAACDKTDPLFCKENPGATGCPLVDGASDDALDMTGIDARVCYGAGTGSICLSEPASGQIIFTNPSTFDTTPGASTNPACLATQPADWKAAGQPDACFLVGTQITIAAELLVIGNRPLVLLASDSIKINANLDAAGHGVVSGPGAPGLGCKPFAQVPDSNTDGGGGGAGGTFMSQGGAGGFGDGTLYKPGLPGTAEGANPQLLRAGCLGQQGGGGQASNNGGKAGAAGGAVYIVAGGAISIAAGATINVSGGGGGGAGRQGGGGGGGSGGMLVLYAPTISSTGVFLMANGGGGASGGDDTTNGNPHPGNDPSSPTAEPTGGIGSDTAGNGGSGYYNDGTAHDATPGTDGGTSNRGGGGGGGGKGWIQANVALAATASPAPAIIP